MAKACTGQVTARHSSPASSSSTSAPGKLYLTPPYPSLRKLMYSATPHAVPPAQSKPPLTSLSLERHLWRVSL